MATISPLVAMVALKGPGRISLTMKRLLMICYPFPPNASAGAVRLNPLPHEDLAAKIGRYGCVVTVEPHYRDGGLGSMICEIAAEQGLSCMVTRCGVGVSPGSIVGEQDYLNAAFGISGAAIADAVRMALRRC